jgi:hypothetical protein
MAYMQIYAEIGKGKAVWNWEQFFKNIAVVTRMYVISNVVENLLTNYCLIYLYQIFHTDTYYPIRM